MNESLLRQSAEMAADFLFKTSITRADGGVRAGFDARKKDYFFVYNEITGYSVSCALECYRQWGNVFFLERAKAGIEYLLRHSGAAGRQFQGFPQGIEEKTGSIIKKYFSFDSAIILQAFCDYYLFHRSDDLLCAIRQVAAWLCDEMQTAKGSFLSYIDENGNRRHIGSAFFLDESCIHAKIAIGLLKTHAITHDERQSDAARRVCQWVLSLIDQKTGAFFTTNRKNHIFAHAHCYAVEALLYFYGIVGAPHFLEAAIQGARYLSQIQTPEGGIIHTPLDRRNAKHCFFPFLHGGMATDATAQALRIWLLADALQGTGWFTNNIERAVNWLMTRQIIQTAAPAVHGAFYYHCRRKVYTWCTQFSLSSLLWLLEEQKNRSDLLKGLF